MVDKFLDFCKTSHQFIFDNSFSIYELLMKAIEKLNELIDVVNIFENKLDAKEDSANITNNRKLSENGDFTGTWYGDTKSNVDQKLTEGLNNYQSLIDYLRANPQIAWSIWDGKFFTTVEPEGELLDGGTFTEFNTQEVDGGLFIYPCQCIIN